MPKILVKIALAEIKQIHKGLSELCKKNRFHLVSRAALQIAKMKSHTKKSKAKAKVIAKVSKKASIIHKLWHNLNAIFKCVGQLP